MEGSPTQDDIRRLLRTFGVRADETINAYLGQAGGGGLLRLRIVLEDVTDYGGSPAPERLRLEVEGEVRR